jgi:hypothetical protein
LKNPCVFFCVADVFFRAARVFFEKNISFIWASEAYKFSSLDAINNIDFIENYLINFMR